MVPFRERKMLATGEAVSAVGIGNLMNWRALLTGGRRPWEGELVDVVAKLCWQTEEGGAGGRGGSHGGGL